MCACVHVAYTNPGAHQTRNMCPRSHGQLMLKILIFVLGSGDGTCVAIGARTAHQHEHQFQHEFWPEQTVKSSKRLIMWTCLTYTSGNNRFTPLCVASYENYPLTFGKKLALVRFSVGLAHHNNLINVLFRMSICKNILRKKK